MIKDPDLHEAWLPVLGYEGHYEVSNLGRVRSLDRKTYRRNRGGTLCERIERGKLLATPPNALGYPRVHLSKEGVRWKTAVHILVCEAFHGPRPPGTEAAHKDSDPTRALADNLRWDTPKGNSADRIGNGTSPVGERHPRARLTEADVLAIRASAEPGAVLAERYSIKQGTVYHIRAKRLWKHL